jgi:hypothetical protein
MDGLPFFNQVKRLAIKAMFSDDTLMRHLVLKGGNLLDVVYKVSARASLDLDFSLDGELESDHVLSDRIARALKSTFAEARYVAFDVTLVAVPPVVSDDLKGFWGGYEVAFKLIDEKKYDELGGDMEKIRRNARAVGQQGSTKFRIDISKHEFCVGKERHFLDGLQIFGYSPSMVVCEKLRAICQQMPEYVRLVKKHPSARARDFVDIHTVAEYFKIDVSSQRFLDILVRMFAAKRVPLSLLGQVKDAKEEHRDDFLAVQETVHPGFVEGFRLLLFLRCGIMQQAGSPLGRISATWDHTRDSSFRTSSRSHTRSGIGEEGRSAVPCMLLRCRGRNPRLGGTDTYSSDRANMPQVC